MQEYQRAFAMLRQQESSDSSEDSSEIECFEQENNEGLEESSYEDTSESTSLHSDRSNKSKTIVSDEPDNESSSLETSASKK